MTKVLSRPNTSRPTLYADTAADLMIPDPVSVREDATVGEAVALLTDRGFSAAPVIDEAGRPVGVLSRADVLVHGRENGDYLEPESHHPADRVLVRDIMTPAVFSVTSETSARRVVEDLVALKVHRLFVVDQGGVLVGVISALDVLRRLAS